MSYKQKALKLAKELGVEIEDRGGEVLCLAPAGKVWDGEFVHELVNSPWDDDTKAKMWREAYERMDECGLVECPDKDCDCKG